MTVRELITQLLDCDMDAKIDLSDDVELEIMHTMCQGSIYHIKDIDKRSINHVFITFDNRNHYVIKGKEKDEEN